MHHAFAVALALVALVLPPPTRAQEVEAASALLPIPSASAGVAVTENVLASTAWPLSGDTAGVPIASSAPSAWGARELERVRTGAAPSLSRHLGVGAGIGAVAGAVFGLWVISIADCGGPNCTTERVVGVAGNALGGAAIGALVGGVLYLIRK